MLRILSLKHKKLYFLEILHVTPHLNYAIKLAKFAKETLIMLQFLTLLPKNITKHSLKPAFNNV